MIFQKLIVAFNCDEKKYILYKINIKRISFSLKTIGFLFNYKTTKNAKILFYLFRKEKLQKHLNF